MSAACVDADEREAAREAWLEDLNSEDACRLVQSGGSHTTADLQATIEALQLVTIAGTNTHCHPARGPNTPPALHC